MIAVTRASDSRAVIMRLGPGVDAEQRRRRLNELESYAGDARIVDEGELPATRTYRNAWMLRGGAVRVDMPRARGIQRGRLRAERDAKLQRMDRTWQRATERGESQRRGRIEAVKQRLRDMPENFDLERFTTPEALKRARPAILDAAEDGEDEADEPGAGDGPPGGAVE